MAADRQKTPGFSDDLTDGRGPGDWKSVYPRAARIAMWLEAVYLSLGGTCFVTKWFYHAIPRRTWHQDRLFWRLFAPWVSGALALALVLLLPSGLFTLLKGATFSTPAVTSALGFIAGYFSDATLGKLAQIANKLFATKPAPGA